jgi:ABC-type Fe3+/spermidine/putrescine transport system ATPase subunit
MAGCLTVEGLHRRFGNLAVADDLTFRVDGGSYGVLLGPSGSGKTSLLHMIAGLLRPDRGSIRLGDRVLDGPGTHLAPELRRMGLVFQDYALWPHLPVFEQVAFSLRLRRAPRRELTQAVRRWLATLRLEGLERHFPHQLSGGQKQRVAIARALAAEPALLLLDEPFSNLDLPLRESLREELAKLHSRLGLTVLHVTHDRQDALEVADRVLVLSRGRLRQEGSPRQLYQEPHDPFVARLLGAANLIPGPLERGNGTLAVAEADRRWVGLPTGTLNGHGVACFRPEAVRLMAEAPAAPPPNCFPATLLRSACQGLHWRHRLQLGDRELAALGPQVLPVGSRVWIHVPPESCRILPPEDAI